MIRRLLVAALIFASVATSAFSEAAPGAPPTPHDNVTVLSDSPPPSTWCDGRYPPGFLVRSSTTGVALWHTQGAKLFVTQVRARQTWTNLQNGKSVWTPSVGNWTFTYDANGNLQFVSSTGILQRIVIPGEGLVSADVGKIYGNVSADPSQKSHIAWQSGRLDLTQYDAICDALH